MPAAQADHHDGVTSRPSPTDGSRDPPTPVVTLTQLAEVVVAPAPGLARLVDHDNMGGVLSAADVADANILQGGHSHRLVYIVLRVVTVLLQLARLQSLDKRYVEIEKQNIFYFLTLCHSVVPLNRSAPQSGSNFAFLASVESPLDPLSAGLLAASILIVHGVSSLV